MAIEGTGESQTDTEGEGPAQPFKGVLGDTSELRIIERLLSSTDSLNITQLANATQISRPTVHKAVRKLLERGVIEVHSTRGNMRFYGLSADWEIGNVLTMIKGKQSAPDNEGEALMRRIQSPTYGREE